MSAPDPTQEVRVLATRTPHAGDLAARTLEEELAAQLAANAGPHPVTESGIAADFDPDADTVEVLLDYARRGDRAAFDELARMRGVPAGDLADFWHGARRRLGLTP